MPEWISAFTSLVALIAAGWAGFTASRLYGIESGRDKRSEDARRREQAAKVAAWCAVHFDEDGTRSNGLVIRNGSEAPIYDLKVESNDFAGSSKPRLQLHVLPPGDYFAAETGDSYRWAFPEHVQALSGLVRPITKKPEWRVTGFSFKDGQDVCWERTDNCGLREVEPPVSPVPVA